MERPTRPRVVESPGPAAGSPSRDRAPGPARLASALYVLAAAAIVAWAGIRIARGGERAGALDAVALFAPLVAYASALAVAARRVRATERASAAPVAIVYGLLVLHALVGSTGSVALAVLSSQQGAGLGLPSAVETLAGLTFPAMLFGWMPPLALLLGARRIGALLAVGALGTAWLLLFGMAAAMRVGL